MFLGLWIPDLFMERVEADKSWSLFCPHEAPGLNLAVGAAFQQLYEQYEATPGKARSVLPARQIWKAIIESQIETGTPYMMYKDACNLKSNQSNLGTIQSSNLCTEIVQFTSPDEISVCNLASIALPMYVNKGTPARFDFQKLYDVTYQTTLNLNRVIDVNYYPVPQAKHSNVLHRPIGVGIQGLADTFILMRMPYDSAEAKQLNIDIFETMYYAALTASKDLAIRDGPYSSYKGSPISKGILQFDMWGVTPSSGRWDWAGLRAEIKRHGIRNSLLLAPMPTASTSQILGNNESFEPYTSNLYVRRTLAGEFVCVNRHLLNDLIALNLWDNSMKDKLIAHDGSVQHINEIPAHIRAIYKTVWEISQKTVIDMSADRGAYVCQSQSLNLHVSDVSYKKLTSMHFYAWNAKLKTGSYYIRTRAVAPQQFTISPEAVKQARQAKINGIIAPVVRTKTTVTSEKQARQQIEQMQLSQESAPSPVSNEEKYKLEQMTPAQRKEYREQQMVCRRNNPESCVMCSG